MVLTNALNRGLLIAGLGISLAGFAGDQAAQARNYKSLRGQVSVMGKPVANASITHWTTRGGSQPKRVNVVRSRNDGRFDLAVMPSAGTVHYLIASVER